MSQYMVRLRNSRGGNIISLAAEIYEMDDVSRLLRLIGTNTPASVPFDPMPERNTSPAEPKFGNVRIMQLAHPVLLDYLKSRKIDLRIAQAVCKEGLFEGCTDYLSYLTLYERGEMPWHSSNEDFLILNSASLLLRAKDRLQGYERIVCCLDRDTTGRRLISELRATFGTRVHDDSIMYDG